MALLSHFTDDNLKLETRASDMDLTKALTILYIKQGDPIRKVRGATRLEQVGSKGRDGSVGVGWRVGKGTG